MEKRFCIDVLENRTVARTQPRQCIAEEILLPVADRTDAVDEDEASNASLISFSSQHGGLTHGLAPALFEEIQYDENGNIQGGSFMQAALPHLHVFAPAHDLASLERLAAHLSF